jgi:hypothetical protein
MPDVPHADLERERASAGPDFAGHGRTPTPAGPNMAPGMGAPLTPADVDAVISCVWALGHQKN